MSEGVPKGGCEGVVQRQVFEGLDYCRTDNTLAGQS